MNWNRYFLSFLLSLILCSAALAEEISWTLHSSSGCTAGTSFSCGSRGYYSALTAGAKALRPLEKAACRPAASGEEEAPLLAGNPLPPDGPTPCDDGSCISEGPGERPWVAVVDWGHEWHGEAVSWLIDEITGPDFDVVLFPLDGGATASVQPRATDLQVLEQLCAILEVTEDQGPPVAVNMSFGRPDSDAPCGGGQTLGCEISAVLDELYSEGVWLVAAAGNHQTELFPGTHPRVMSVGSLDVETFRLSDQAIPAWQSPAADALMPASAICLPEGSGSWGPPPGTSFAAAVMTSWLTASGLPLENPAIGSWAPLELQDGSQQYYHLGNMLGSFPTSRLGAIDDLLGNILSKEVGGCHPADFFASPTMVSVVPAAKSPNAEPLVSYRPTSNGPTPDPDPCLPCTGGWDDGPGGGGLVAGGGAEKSSSEIGMAVSFMDSPGVPEGLRLVDILLVRSRDDLYFELDMSQTQKAQLIDDIAAGQVQALSFLGLFPHLLLGDSVSVVYILEPVIGESEGRVEKGIIGHETQYFWSSTPIYEVTINWPT